MACVHVSTIFHFFASFLLSRMVAILDFGVDFGSNTMEQFYLDSVREVIHSVVCHKQSKQTSTGFSRFGR